MNFIGHRPDDALGGTAVLCKAQEASREVCFALTPVSDLEGPGVRDGGSRKDKTSGNRHKYVPQVRRRSWGFAHFKPTLLRRLGSVTTYVKVRVITCGSTVTG
jgi:hypothetical protein